MAKVACNPGAMKWISLEVESLRKGSKVFEGTDEVGGLVVDFAHRWHNVGDVNKPAQRRNDLFRERAIDIGRFLAQFINGYLEVWSHLDELEIPRRSSALPRNERVGLYTDLPRESPFADGRRAIEARSDGSLDRCLRHGSMGTNGAACGQVVPFCPYDRRLSVWGQIGTSKWQPPVGCTAGAAISREKYRWWDDEPTY